MVNISSVRILKRGRNYQIYYHNLIGERRRLSAGNNLQNAQRIAVRFNDWLLEGREPEIELKKSHQINQLISIKSLFPMFMERHGNLRSRKTQASYYNSFKNICRCPELVDNEISLVTKGLVLDYMHQRIKKDGVTTATVNREAAFLKCMFAKAVEWDVIANNILHRLKLLPEAEKRDVYLSVEQAKELINELYFPLDNIVEFAIYTGFRRENILNLRIEPVRFHETTSTAEVELVVKGGKKKPFPLSSLAVEVLKRAIGDRKEGYVFINLKTQTRYVSIHKTFDKVVRKLGLTVNGTKFRFHDLRHVFATWLHREGVSLDALRTLLGHRDRATTDRYTTIDIPTVGDLLNRMPRIREQKQKSLDSNTIKAKSQRILTQIDTFFDKNN